MAKKPVEPKATVTLLYYDWGIRANIENFERLNARQIQQGVEVALREWSTLQQSAILEERRKQRDERGQYDN